MKKMLTAAVAVCAALIFTACLSKQVLEDAPIITSATHQHALYNGMGQPIEAKVSKEGAPTPVISYFLNEEDLHADKNGSSEAPSEVGDYYARVRRPAGNGYKAGKDITVEYHIQKALVTISADEKQEFAYDGNPKEAVFSVDQNVKLNIVYCLFTSDTPLQGPPSERGLYSVFISYDGDARRMGASKKIELIVK
jgi:hypothetical protein